MNQRVFAISISLILASIGVGGVLAQGCGGTGDYTCPAPIFDRKDRFGRPDPCCHGSICCENPQVDHYAKEPGTNPPHMLWDPCCMTEECPGVNVDYKPPTAGSSSGSEGGGNAGSGGHASGCDGPCAPAVPDGFWGPTLLWKGAPGQEPTCPVQAPRIAYRGYAGLQPSLFGCASCECLPPSGNCSLPAKMWASSVNCNQAGGNTTTFDPPQAWDGACTALNAIPAGAVCNGAPCVKSLRIEPMRLDETPCVAHAIIPKLRAPREKAPPSIWATSALACQSDYSGSCGHGDTFCAAVAMPGFLLCVARAGEAGECPGSYPAKHVFYGDRKDSRTCSECTCGKPTGGQCSAVLSVYKDTACGAASLVTTIGAQDAPFCDDFSAGLGLGSKTVTKAAYLPGTCAAAGGDVTGEVAPANPTTFCCDQS